MSEVIGSLSAMITGAAAAGPVPDTPEARFWIAFMVNTVFFTGMAQASVILAAIYRTTRSTWSSGFERIAFSGIYFLPLSLGLIVVALWGGHDVLYSWARDAGMFHGGKAWWLNWQRMLMRDFGILAFLCFLSWRYFFIYLRPKSEKRYHSMGFSAPSLIFLYCVLWTMLAFDLVMSVDPHWYSNLFGAYIWISNVYLAWAVTAIIAAVLFRKTGFTKEISVEAFHDMGKMTFAFCCVTMYFLWSQFFVIWYGNLPEEVPYVLARTELEKWGPVGAVVLVVALIVPFFLLLSRKLKRTPPALSAVALLGLVGMLIERYFLIMPSIWEHPVRYFTVVELVVSLVFAGVYAGCVAFFLQRHPVEGVFREDHP